MELPAHLDAVLARYGLDAPRVEGLIESSTRNDNAIVADGGGRRLVLRRFRRNAELERVRFQLRFQRHLEASGVPVPAILFDREGADLVADADGWPWVLFEFVEGAEYDFSRIEQARAAGELLASVQRAGQVFGEAFRPYELMAPWRRFVAEPRAVADELRATWPEAGLETDLDGFAGRLEVLAGTLTPARLDALPWGWTHGDFHGRNLLYEGDAVAGLLDFDKVEPAPLAMDVGRGIASFGRSRRGAYDVRAEVAAAFLAGYESWRRLEPAEFEAMPVIHELDSAPWAAITALLVRDGEDPASAVRGDLEGMGRASGQAEAMRVVFRELGRL
ncbi:MAG: phosphotransferase [Dehalococcoidia bacterium]